jgi:hypothetical protein
MSQGFVIRCTPRGMILRVAGVFVAACLLSLATEAGADDADTLFRDRLDTGEFAPAFAEAGHRTDALRRDAQLADLATAQWQVGARQASLASTAEILDDRRRDKTLREIAKPSRGRPGGGVQPDFDSLMELIQSTIAPTTWSDVGGAGAMKPFPGGVYVDPTGALRRVERVQAGEPLAPQREAAVQAGANRDVRRTATLRKVSLTRLEKEVQFRRATGQAISEDLQVLAGLQRIKYLLVYPESGDLVLAGPAGNWQSDGEGRTVSTEHGRPVVRLDDLVVVFRHVLRDADSRFGCSITPTQEALARTQAFVNESSQSPIKAGGRKAWLEKLRSQLGAQTIEVNGIDPRSRAAQVLVEADYRMKLVGIGLEEGTLDVPSYLSMLNVRPGQAPPAMSVLRWWFTMNYDALRADPERTAFELQGQGVKVLSENELLTERGERVHTGDSDLLNREFAHNFTQHYAALAAKYPIYAELQNVFDLALIAALIKSEDLAERANWHLTCFLDPEQFATRMGAVPASVETVVNHRVANKVHVLAAVSGGVAAEPQAFVRAEAIQTDKTGSLNSERSRSSPKSLSSSAWWWD